MAPHCRATWAVRGSQASVDRGGVLSVRSDAVPGDSFEVLVLVARRWGRQWAYVVDPVPNAIVGTWTQREAQCRGGGPPAGLVGELIFLRNGRFSVTAQPFEYHVDAWGRYAYDAANARLSLTWDAAGPREYHATLAADGDLAIDRFTVPSGEQCDAIFRRVSTRG